MTAPHRRHDISERVWELLEPHLPGGSGKKGRPARDNRLSLNAVFGTGTPWRDLWPDLGDWKNTLVASADGGIAGCGKNFWIPSLMSRTWRG